MEIYQEGKGVAIQARKDRSSGDILDGTDFCILERSLQVVQRLSDLALVTDDVEFKSLVKPVFDWVNVVTTSRNQGIMADTPAPRRFDFSKEDDISRYFGLWLPSQMGIYLARLHNLKLVHGYPHSQNWSAVGTLYDLDSVRGVPLGDLEPTEEDYTQDFSRTLSGIFYMFISSDVFHRTKLLDDAETSFLNGYRKERKEIGGDFVKWIKRLTKTWKPKKFQA